MATSKPLLAVLLLSLLAAASASAISDGDISLPFALLPADPSSAAVCRGSVGECLAGGDDEELGLGHHGRALYDGGYLSYRALQRNNVPCSRRGDSYYSNCRPGAAANPYTRGCSAITRCRG
ncbi:unnamed protein product [Urochloa decumbens]|uniref:Uncharacterized protein n=1 Tax=Urochloa decumbens TaxID=240449 RepID=A0ABC9ASQ5_9POAL